jgi:Fe2+ or Zn2+ uptake regulation protein
VNENAKQLRLNEFERLCQEQGVPCTVQRHAVLAAVLERDDHPTADQIFRDVSERHRGISRATVHRTLETLVWMGMITKLCHPGSVTRYDPHTGIHHHLMCMRCDKVIDFQDEHLDALGFPDTSTFGFEVVDLRVELRGICKQCRAGS